MRLLTVSHIKNLVKNIGLSEFYLGLIAELENTFSRWNMFQKTARHSFHLDHGVIELMPTCDDEFYSVKYVNGHPNNPAHQKLTVAAMGILSEVNSGYPLLISEMTLLTAFRTSATSALAAKYLANRDTKTIGIIGCGAQSEFQVQAQLALFPIKTIKYFDIDNNAMKKFHENLKHLNLELVPCDQAEFVLKNVDIVTTATAAKMRTEILNAQWILPGMHINAIGGDCPGKTELSVELLKQAKIVVEYLPQSKIEGEIQQLSNEYRIYAELWELITKKKPGRVSQDEITLFDSVGFALEDFAILKYVYALSREYKIGSEVELIPNVSDPKDLFSALAT